MSLDSIRVLIVDDQPAALRILCQMLGLAEDELISASSAEEAFAIAYAADPDVALVNSSLMGKDGISLARLLRDANPRTQVVLFTGVPFEPKDRSGDWPFEMDSGRVAAQPAANPNQSQEICGAQAHSRHIHAVNRTVDRSHILSSLSVESLQSGRECLKRASHRIETSCNRLRTKVLNAWDQMSED